MLTGLSFSAHCYLINLSFLTCSLICLSEKLINKARKALLWRPIGGPGWAWGSLEAWEWRGITQE